MKPEECCCYDCIEPEKDCDGGCEGAGPIYDKEACTTCKHWEYCGIELLKFEHEKMVNYIHAILLSINIAQKTGEDLDLRLTIRDAVEQAKSLIWIDEEKSEE